MNISGPTYVYNGPGSWNVDVAQTVRMLEGVENSDGVKIFDAREIKCVENVDDVDRGTKLLVIPGGSMPTMSINYFSKNSGKVIQYVQGGGRYLGICAGALLTTSYLGGKPGPLGAPFADPELERLKKLGLLYTDKFMQKKNSTVFSLYSGKTIAPHVVKNINPESTENLCSVGVEGVIDGVSKVFQSFHYSGPVFLEPPEGGEVLLRYSDRMRLLDFEGGYNLISGRYEQAFTGKVLEMEKPVAALSCRAGEGVMVLTGVHPEIDPMTYSEDAKKYSFPVSELPEDLLGSNEERKAVLASFFRALNIN